MVSTGVVRRWNDHEGWGVIDSDATPGGCWASFAAVLVDGYRSLEEGQQVRFSFEAADQDGYAFRAVEVWPADHEPAPRPPSERAGASSAYHSTLIITWDDEPDDGGRRR